jgi:hypothetical protein
MHHWEPKAKDENLPKPPLFQDLAAAFGLVESKAQKHSTVPALPCPGDGVRGPEHPAVLGKCPNLELRVVAAPKA